MKAAILESGQVLVDAGKGVVIVWPANSAYLEICRRVQRWRGVRRRSNKVRGNESKPEWIEIGEIP
ncbi:MAG TPA: hypothetical protein VNX28_14790 [Gemmataceae bacterium]|nr:hypothetical protein [Gemmataceae bacterium]